MVVGFKEWLVVRESLDQNESFLKNVGKGALASALSLGAMQNAYPGDKVDTSPPAAVSSPEFSQADIDAKADLYKRLGNRYDKETLSQQLQKLQDRQETWQLMNTISAYTNRDIGWNLKKLIVSKELNNQQLKQLIKDIDPSTVNKLKKWNSSEYKNTKDSARALFELFPKIKSANSSKEPIKSRSQVGKEPTRYSQDLIDRLNAM